jgi:glycolate oxidase iron-sulfur subunit
MGKLARPIRGLLPGKFRAMLELLPARLPKPQPLPEIYPAKGTRRARVALLAGCVQQVLGPQINLATLRVLAENGVETIIPKHQDCCGALSMHTGAAGQARALARQNLRIFPKDVDAILTNAAGCGSGMQEYGLLFKGLAEEKAAEAFARQVKDVTVFLDELGFKTPGNLPKPLKVAYHDACHLAHAQGVQATPRKLLRSIANLTLLEIVEGDICCGSAGTYNLEQPAIAHELGQRKARHILNTGAEAVVTGNIGCMTQIQSHLSKPLPLYHTMEVLDRAYQAK